MIRLVINLPMIIQSEWVLKINSLIRS